MNYLNLEVVTDSTKKNLEMRVDAEHGATEGKFDLARRAKEANLDAIHDTVHEMAKRRGASRKTFKRRPNQNALAKQEAEQG